MNVLPKAMDEGDERDLMETALRAIADNPHLAKSVADTTLALVEANRSIRLDLLATHEDET